MKRIFLPMILFLCLMIISLVTSAQRLIIKLNNGTENMEMLSTVQKLYFSGDELIVDFKTATDDVYELEELQKLYFDAAVSIGENTSYGSKRLSIYPNPASDFITVMDVPAEADVISIYGMDGRLVFTRDVCSNREKLDISGLTDGLYFVNASGYTSKFIKK